MFKNIMLLFYVSRVVGQCFLLSCLMLHREYKWKILQIQCGKTTRIDLSSHNLVTIFPKYPIWLVKLLYIYLPLFRLVFDFYGYCLWNSILNKGKTHQNPIPEIKEGMTMWLTTSSICLLDDIAFSKSVTFVPLSILEDVYGVKMEKE